MDVVGTMCIPPKEGNAESHFLEMNKINKELCLSGLSMGMSEDYLEAAQNNATIRTLLNLGFSLHIFWYF